MTSPEADAHPWVPELDFSARLALVRQRMGWNMKEAAKECGVPAQSWRAWEVDRRIPHNQITIAMAIATRTGVDVDWLVYGPNGKVPAGQVTSKYLSIDPLAPRVVAPVGRTASAGVVHGDDRRRSSGRRPATQTAPSSPRPAQTSRPVSRLAMA